MVFKLVIYSQVTYYMPTTLFYYPAVGMVYKSWLKYICCEYGNIWDIKFNPLKSQIITFGGQQPPAVGIIMEDSVIPLSNRVKYLGCYFLSLFFWVNFMAHLTTY